MAIHLITGAGGALGSALADVLVARGDRVAGLDLSRSASRLSAAHDRHGASFLALPVEHADASTWASTLPRVETELGVLDGAALVAGGWQGGAPLHEADDAVFAAMMSQNLESVYLALRAILPGMVARGRGSIVVVGTRAAVQPWTSAGAAAYAASKAAVTALAQAVAAEVLASGVRINAVLPSTLDTPANRAAMPDVDPSRWVSLPSLAGVMSFLLSDAARDVTGALLPVYGRA